MNALVPLLASACVSAPVSYGPPPERVRITGQRLDAAGRFGQTYSGIAGGYFPSYLIVPTAGCWRVTVASAGHRASFAFSAVDL